MDFANGEAHCEKCWRCPHSRSLGKSHGDRYERSGNFPSVRENFPILRTAPRALALPWAPTQAARILLIVILLIVEEHFVFGDVQTRWTLANRPGLVFPLWTCDALRVPRPSATRVYLRSPRLRAMTHRAHSSLTCPRVSWTTDPKELFVGSPLPASRHAW